MDASAVINYLKSLQRELIDRVTALDPQAQRVEDSWIRPEGGGGISCAIASGSLIEKGGINFSHVQGQSLPSSATLQRAELQNRPFEAMGVSVVFHPLNPHVPCTHMNVRFFRTTDNCRLQPVWWFGGGFDLTPVYPHSEDAIAWHRAAHAACQPFGEQLYPRFKAACDRYFFLPHRNETRGIGGIFFDDFCESGFAHSFALTRSVGDAFMPAWAEIVLRRKHTEFNEHHKAFQLFRRGRYVEFNLLYDRGTRFGLQSNGRTESILMSLPPLARWEYDFQPPADSIEAGFHQQFFTPRDWLHSTSLEPPTA